MADSIKGGIDTGLLFSQIDEKISKVDAEINRNIVPAGKVFAYDASNNKIAEGNAWVVFAVPGNAAKIVSNGDFKADINSANGVEFFVKGKAGLTGLGVDSSLIASGDVTVTGDVAGKIQSGGHVGVGGDLGGQVIAKDVIAAGSMEHGGYAKSGTSVDIKGVLGGVAVAKNSIFAGSMSEQGDTYSGGDTVIKGDANGYIKSDGNIKISGMLNTDATAKGWVMAKKIGPGVIINAPQLYLEEGAAPPENYQGKVDYVPAGKWDSFVPPPVKVSAAAADLRNAIAAAGGTFTNSGEQLAVATTGNVSGSKETYKS